MWAGTAAAKKVIPIILRCKNLLFPWIPACAGISINFVSTPASRVNSTAQKNKPPCGGFLFNLDEILMAVILRPRNVLAACSRAYLNDYSRYCVLSIRTSGLALY